MKNQTSGGKYLKREKIKRVDQKKEKPEVNENKIQMRKNK